MAQKIIVYWRDIPAQVIVKKGRTSAKRELPETFIKAIDQCAMKNGADETDAYLNDWRRASPVTVSDDLEAEADAGIEALLADYPKDRLIALASSDGYENKD